MKACEQPLIPEVTVHQAAEILSVCRKTIYRLIAKGKVAARRLSGCRGSQYRLLLDDVMALRHDYRIHDHFENLQRTMIRGSRILDLEMIRLDQD
jgi:excisionase family DNA binding protein